MRNKHYIFLEVNYYSSVRTHLKMRAKKKKINKLNKHNILTILLGPGLLDIFVMTRTSRYLRNDMIFNKRLNTRPPKSHNLISC